MTLICSSQKFIATKVYDFIYSHGRLIPRNMIYIITRWLGVIISRICKLWRERNEEARYAPAKSTATLDLLAN